jgi:hypothetical protein
MTTRMPNFSRRALSDGEIALGRSVFKDAIPWPRIGVAQIPKLNFGAMVPLGETIVFSSWRAAQDFAAALPQEQGWFIHELAHVWQAKTGVVLGVSKLVALGSHAYRYQAKAGARLQDYNIEQQAEIARHLFLARRGISLKDAPDAAWLERIWPV